MTCYSTYINNYNNSMETLLDSKKNNPEFAQFLRVCAPSPMKLVEEEKRKEGREEKEKKEKERNQLFREVHVLI